MIKQLSLLLRIHCCKNHDITFLLQGSNLQSLKREDILITLDEMDCPVIYIDSSMLRCDLSVTMDKTKTIVTNLSFDVEVR